MRYFQITVCLVLTFCAALDLPAQDKAIGPSVVITGKYLGLTPPLRDLPALTEDEWRMLAKKEEQQIRNPEAEDRSYPFAETALPKGPDPVMQREMGSNRETRAPLQNFNGTDGTGLPPDANGSIGHDYYMQTINYSYTIFDRAGTIVAGPSLINSLFYGLDGANYNDGDPIVLYDEQADRWLIAEFSIAGTNDYVLVAISATNDPSGSWHKYSFDVADIPDYPKFGVWQDGYYMGTNNPSGNDIFVFERSKMLLGQAAQMVGFDNIWRPTSFDGFMCVPPLDNDGPFAPSGNPGLFITLNDDASGGGTDQLWIYQLAVDWVTPANSSFNRTQQLDVASFDSNFGPTRANIVQQGTAQKLDAIPQVIMNPPQYRNFGSYETIVCCHTVDVDNTDHAGVRWYELQRVSGGNWTIRQQGTYSPDGNSRWMASVMLNGSNEIAMGYSVSGSTVYPAIRYCGQSSAAYNAANSTMDLSEQTIQDASFSQTGANRWGDYSAMQVDPEDDRTFWFTSQYIGASQARKTKIANFQIGNVALTANFVASNRNPQNYTTITFTDVSFGGPAVWNWSITPNNYNFVGGTSASSKNPQVQFTAAGSYNVTLTISGGGNNDTETKTGFITVQDGVYPYLPFNEDFSEQILPPCWKNIDYVGNGQVWVFNNPGNRPVNTSTAGNGFAIVDSYYYGPGYNQNADLVSPLLDLSSYSTVNLYFQYFFPYYTPNPDTCLGTLSYSKNDGATWTTLLTVTNSANPSTYNTNITTQIAGQSRVRFKWNYKGYGYYWAVDDISITGTGPNLWTGTTSGDWATTSNWSAGSVPTGTSNVIIPSTAPNWPVYTGNFTLGTTCDKLTMYGNSQLTVSGNVTIPAGKTLSFFGDGQINLGGNWINNGNFLPGNGTVKFTGATAASVISSTTGIQAYERSTFTKGMTNLSGANPVQDGDNKASDVNIGFTFNYLGTDYTQARICTNGWLSLNLTGGTTADNTLLFGTAAPNTTLAPWFDDLNFDNLSKLYYKTEGSSPNRVFTAEWKSVLTYAINASAKISFQVKLYETTNIIEFCYGNLETGTHSGAESASIGIEDGTGGSGNFIEATTGSFVTSVTNLVSTTQWPAVNYRFTPPSQVFKNMIVDKSGSSLSLNQNSIIKGNITITNGTVNGPAGNSGILKVGGNWSNNGTFNPGSTRVILDGSTNQNIGGSTAVAFPRLTVKNPAGITLMNNLTVNDTLIMTTGNINCGSYTLELGTSASNTGFLSWTSGNIAGNFKRWIAASTTSPVDFPLGTSTANHKARITFANNTAGSLTAKFEPGDPGNNTGFPLTEDSQTINADNIYTEGSWTLVPTALSSTSYALELTGTGFASAGTPDETVRILKRPDGGGDWTLNGTHVAGSPPVAKRSGLSGFSRFILGKPGPNGYSISGSLTYYNQANTPLNSGVTVKLYQGGTQVGSTFNVTSGIYSFSGLSPGTYEIRASSSNPVDGSINTTDAAQVNYWGAIPYQVEKVRFYAGDVTGATYYINSTDALRIQSNFVNGTAFEKGSWTFWKAGETISSNESPSESFPSVTIISSNITANIYGLCSGDFNRSFVPGARKSAGESLELVHSGLMIVRNNEEFELPIRLVNPSFIGAISLVIDYPADLLEVKDVRMNAGGFLDWSTRDNELRVGWSTMNPASIAGSEELITLKLKTTERFTGGKSVILSLAADPLNELADDHYEGISHALISCDVIEAAPDGINGGNGAGELTMICIPNPFRDMTLVSYNLPRDGRVNLDIRNIMGISVALLVNEFQPAGKHAVQFDSEFLPGGVYFATLSLNSGKDQLIRTVKLINCK